MLKATVLMGAAATVLLLSACADDAYYDGHRHYADVGNYDVWYDGFYGPYVDGYWGDGDVFFYSDPHGGFLRDDAHHFRHERWEGARGFHAGRHPG
jgi:hypothetical protein